MGREAGPSCRLCRREGTKLFLKGSKCLSVKCPVDKRAFPPGQHGQRRRPRVSDYGLQLREKQKVKRIYGVGERQFRRYFALAQRRKGVTGQFLLQILESRLDNVLFRSGFVSSRVEGRQLVRHRAVTLNNRMVDIPSAPVSVGDTLQIAANKNGWVKRVKEQMEQAKDRQAPAWIQTDKGQLKAVVLRSPQKEDMGLAIQEQLIVELYSK